MILVGELSLWVALLMAAWAGVVSFAGGAFMRRDLITSGRRGIYAAMSMLVLASAGLWTAFFIRDFSLRSVAFFSSANLPAIYTLTALWTGRAGAILFWCLIVAIYSSIAVLGDRARKSELTPYVTATVACVIFLALTLVCFRAQPFERLDWTPQDGMGMNPRLQNLRMALNAPLMYLGSAATTLPFAFAAAGVVTRRFDAEWLTAIRKWARVAWLFSTIGMVFGMRWAYMDVTRDRYWAWYPLDSGLLLPWLVNTALLHLLFVQEKHGTFRGLTVALAVSGFLISIPAVFVASTALDGSVYSFARSPLFAAGAVAICLGIVLMLGIMPGNRRRWGGSVAHAGMVLMLAVFAGAASRKEFDLTLKEGDSKALIDPSGHRWLFLNQGISQYSVLNRDVTAVVLDLKRDGTSAGVLATERRQYVDSRGAPTFEPSTEPGIRQSWSQDVYVALTRIRDDRSAELHVTFHPFVSWIWIGGALMAIGGLITMRPRSGAASADEVASTAAALRDT